MKNTLRIFIILSLMTAIQSLACANETLGHCFAGAKTAGQTPGERDQKRLFCLERLAQHQWSDCVRTANGMEYVSSSDRTLFWCLSKDSQKRMELPRLRNGLSLMVDPELKEDLVWSILKQHASSMKFEECSKISDLMPYSEIKQHAKKFCKH